MNDIWSTIEPVIYCSRLLGLWSFEKRHPNRYRKNCHARITKILIIMIAYVILFNAAYNEGLYALNNATNRSGVLQFFTIFYYIGIVGTTIMYYIVNEIFGTKLMRQMKEVDKTDSRFEEQRLVECNKSLWKFCGVAISGTFVTIILDFYISMGTTRNSTTLEPMVYYLSYAVHITMSIQFCMWTVALRLRFALLNENLELIIEESCQAKTYPRKENDFMDTIAEIADHHQKLAEVCREINFIYAIPITANITLIFVVLIYNGYLMLYIVTFRTIEVSSLISTVAYLTTNSIELFYIVYFSTRVCNQVQFSSHRAYPQ